LSKIIDINDLGISFAFFNCVDNMWGVHTIDRFASMGNNKLPRFNSLYNVLGSLEPVIKIHLLVRRV